MIELKTGYKVVHSTGEIGIVIRDFHGTSGVNDRIVYANGGWNTLSAADITEVFKTHPCDALSPNGLEIHEDDKRIFPTKKEKMIEIDGKEYSTETIKKALQEYVK